MTSDQPEQDIGILIVDDEEPIRETMSQFLQRAGFRTVTAGNGESALQILGRDTVAVAITDILMPGIDGLELTQKMRSQFDVDVMVMTGFQGDYSYEDAIEKGASDFIFKPVRFEELLLRLKRILRERGLKSDRDRMMRQLHTQAITDELTQLFNARHFHHQLELEIDRARRYDRPLSLVLLDIDHFKWFNDNYGHLEGDKVLAELGKIIKGCLRSMDSAYRYGGEEFTVILPETTCEDARHVAERIRTAVAEKQFKPVDDANVNMTISAGVTQYTAGESAASFVQRSDKAMYVSKEGGRNQVSVLSGATPA